MSRKGPRLPGSPHQNEDPDFENFQEYEMEIEVKCPECGRYLGLFNGLCRETEEIIDSDGRKRTIIRDLIRCPNCDELTLYDTVEK